MERMDDVNPDIERLFRAKEARRARLAGLPFHEKALKPTHKAEIDSEAAATLNSDTPRDLDRHKLGHITVKVINHPRR